MVNGDPRSFDTYLTTFYPQFCLIILIYPDFCSSYHKSAFFVDKFKIDLVLKCLFYDYCFNEILDLAVQRINYKLEQWKWVRANNTPAHPF